MSNYPAFIVHFMKNGQAEKAVFLELPNALDFAARVHGYIGGLIEAPLSNQQTTKVYNCD